MNLARIGLDTYSLDSYCDYESMCPIQFYHDTHLLTMLTTILTLLLIYRSIEMEIPFFLWGVICLFVIFLFVVFVWYLTVYKFSC